MADEPTNARSTIVEPIKPIGGSIDWGLIIGIGGGFLALLGGAFLEGSSPTFYMVLSAAVIVFGGTLGATMASVGMKRFLEMPKTFMAGLRFARLNRQAAVRTLVGFAEKARREGLLVLEDDLAEVDHDFLRKGVQLVVDGTDPELVKDILQTEVDSLAERHEREASAWMTMGGFSPTLGIIGTVMGLVFVLGNLSDPSSLGPLIAVAFVATFYGVAFANLIYLPIGLKLKANSEDELAALELMIEGILAIQSGDNPRIVEEKLLAFLEDEEREIFRLEREAANEFDLAA